MICSRSLWFCLLYSIWIFWDLLWILWDFYGNHKCQWLLVKLTPFLLGAKTTFANQRGRRICESGCLKSSKNIAINHTKSRILFPCFTSWNLLINCNIPKYVYHIFFSLYVKQTSLISWKYSSRYTPLYCNMVMAF